MNVWKYSIFVGSGSVPGRSGVRDAAPHAEKVPDRRAVHVEGPELAREIILGGVIQFEFPLFGQTEHLRGDDRLSHAGGGEWRVWGHGVQLAVNARGPRPAPRVADDDGGRDPGERALLHRPVEHRLEGGGDGLGEGPRRELREVAQTRDLGVGARDRRTGVGRRDGLRRRRARVDRRGGLRRCGLRRCRARFRRGGASSDQDRHRCDQGPKCG